MCTCTCIYMYICTLYIKHEHVYFCVGLWLWKMFRPVQHFLRKEHGHVNTHRPARWSSPLFEHWWLSAPAQPPPSHLPSPSSCSLLPGPEYDHTPHWTHSTAAEEGGGIRIVYTYMYKVSFTFTNVHESWNKAQHESQGSNLVRLEPITLCLDKCFNLLLVDKSPVISAM